MVLKPFAMPHKDPELEKLMSKNKLVNLQSQNTERPQYEQIPQGENAPVKFSCGFRSLTVLDSGVFDVV